MQGVISATVGRIPSPQFTIFLQASLYPWFLPWAVCWASLYSWLHKRNEKAESKIEPRAGELTLSLNHTTPQSSRLDALAQLLSSTGAAVIFLLMQLCVTLLGLHQQEQPMTSLLP